MAVNSIGRCRLCGYEGRGPAHSCARREQLKDCPVCGARDGAPCLEASEYTPAYRDPKDPGGRVVAGERRPTGLYFERKPHHARLA